jgi:hypothetical protein
MPARPLSCWRCRAERPAHRHARGSAAAVNAGQLGSQDTNTLILIHVFAGGQQAAIATVQAITGQHISDASFQALPFTPENKVTVPGYPAPQDVNIIDRNPAPEPRTVRHRGYGQQRHGHGAAERALRHPLRVLTRVESLT